jgi:hypothetical protein
VATTAFFPALHMAQGDLETRQGGLEAALAFYMSGQGVSTAVTLPNITKVTVKLANFLVHRLNDDAEALNVIEVGFATSSNLKRHLLIHEIMHNCPKCKKKFTSLVEFQQHKRKCKFTCSVCGKS